MSDSIKKRRRSSSTLLNEAKAKKEEDEKDFLKKAIDKPDNGVKKKMEDPKAKGVKTSDDDEVEFLKKAIDKPEEKTKKMKDPKAKGPGTKDNVNEADKEDDYDDEEEVEEAAVKKEEEDEGEADTEKEGEKDDDEEEDDDDKKEKKPFPFQKKESKKVSVKESVDALLHGEAMENLSEDFRSKCELIFEAAVQKNVNEQIAELDEQYATYVAEELEKSSTELEESMVGQLNDYLSYVVEEWMEENKLAVENGIRTEITESFINSLKETFEAHYIDVPEGKIDMLDEAIQEKEKSDEALNEEINKNVELSKEIAVFKKAAILAEVADNLSDTEFEKFETLGEEISFDTLEDYKEKLVTIKENYFPKSGKAGSEDLENLVEDGEMIQVEEKNGVMSKYTTAISKQMNHKKG